MPRITKAPEERRQEILDTAMRLFYQNGYEKTSIADIAQEMQALFDTAIDQYAGQLVGRMTEILRQPGLTLREIILQMPTFLDTEADDNFTYKLCHGPQGHKLHQQLSMAVCAKMQPIVQEQLDLAKARGEIQVEDTRTVASFCVYGQLGVLLCAEIPGEERVRRTKAFLLEMLHLK